MATKRYLSALFGTILAVTLVIAAINVVIDPFGALGTNTVGLFFSSEREVKWSLVDDHPHDALILGSSKTTYIGPRDFSDYRFFNASFRSGVPEEFREYLEQHGDGVRMVLLGLDFFMFNQRRYPRSGAVPATADPFKQGFLQDISMQFGRFSLANLFSWDMLAKSIEAVGRSRRGLPPAIRRDGARTTAAKVWADGERTQPDYEVMLNYLARTDYADFEFADFRLDELRRIKKLMAARSVPLKVFINPLNESILSLIRGLDCYPDFVRFRREIATIFPDVVDLSDSAYGSPRNYWWRDPSHYRPATAKLFIGERLGIH